MVRTKSSSRGGAAAAADAGGKRRANGSGRAGLNGAAAPSHQPPRGKKGRVISVSGGRILVQGVVTGLNAAQVKKEYCLQLSAGWYDRDAVPPRMRQKFHEKSSRPLPRNTALACTSEVAVWEADMRLCVCVLLLTGDSQPPLLAISAPSSPWIVERYEMIGDEGMWQAQPAAGVQWDIVDGPSVVCFTSPTTAVVYSKDAQSGRWHATAAPTVAAKNSNSPDTVWRECTSLREVTGLSLQPHIARCTSCKLDEGHFAIGFAGGGGLPLGRLTLKLHPDRMPKWEPWNLLPECVGSEVTAIAQCPFSDDTMYIAAGTHLLEMTEGLVVTEARLPAAASQLVCLPSSGAEHGSLAVLLADPLHTVIVVHLPLLRNSSLVEENNGIESSRVCMFTGVSRILEADFTGSGFAELLTLPMPWNALLREQLRKAPRPLSVTELSALDGGVTAIEPVTLSEDATDGKRKRDSSQVRCALQTPADQSAPVSQPFSQLQQLSVTLQRRLRLEVKSFNSDRALCAFQRSLISSCRSVIVDQVYNCDTGHRPSPFPALVNVFGGGADNDCEHGSGTFQEAAAKSGKLLRVDIRAKHYHPGSRTVSIIAMIVNECPSMGAKMISLGISCPDGSITCVLVHRLLCFALRLALNLYCCYPFRSRSEVAMDLRAGEGCELCAEACIPLSCINRDPAHGDTALRLAFSCQWSWVTEEYQDMGRDCQQQSCVSILWGDACFTPEDLLGLSSPDFHFRLPMVCPYTIHLLLSSRSQDLSRLPGALKHLSQQLSLEGFHSSAEIHAESVHAQSVRIR
jgi:hypothetical protein